MNTLRIAASVTMVGLLMAAPAFAQTSSTGKQKTDGADPTSVGPGSMAYRQKTDGADPTSIGPASGAYKQKTQSLSHSEAPTGGVAKQN